MLTFSSFKHLMRRSSLALGVTAAMAVGVGLAPSTAHATAPLIQNMPLFSLVPGGQADAVKLTGLNTTQYFQFGVRSDELVNDARLELEYTPSPSLLPAWSQINVSLNGQLQETIAIKPEHLGKATRHAVRLNTKQIKDLNQVTIEFVGHYRTVCETPTDPTLWLTLSPESRLHVNKSKIRLSNDLSRFPAPFIDTQTRHVTRLPIVFASTPSDTLTTAAAIVATTTGKHAQWRGADFPVFIGQTPVSSHFVTFATNAERPAFIQHLPQAEGPEIWMLDAPDSAFAKMLILAGRDEADVLTAAKALGQGELIMIGERVRVRNFKQAEPRNLNDAPNWITGDREVELSELMQYPQQLTARGVTTPRSEIEMRLAPDLFLVGADNIRLNLRYRYTQPAPGDSVQLQVRVNEFLAGSHTLEAKAPTEHTFVLPSFTGGLEPQQSSAFSLMHRNKLALSTSYNVAMEEGTPENCKSAALRVNQLEIDPSSTLSFENAYHFARLPNLSLFTQSGYPFTRYADLSKTVAVIPKDVEAPELTMLFNTMGRLGSATQVAGTHVTVTSQATQDLLKNKDILIVGELPPTLTDLTENGAKSLQDMVGDILESSVSNTPMTHDKDKPSVIAEEGLAALIGMQSPFTSKRSVVALLGEGQRGKHLLNTYLKNPNELNAVKGSVALVTESKIVDFTVGKSFTVGNLPWYQKIWLTVGKYPLLLVLSTIVVAFILGSFILKLMRRRISSRH